MNDDSDKEESDRSEEESIKAELEPNTEPKPVPSVELSLDAHLDDVRSFELEAVIGFNKSVGIRCVRTQPNENLIMYTMGHIVVILNISTKNIRYIFGHGRFIRVIELDEKSRFLLTADDEIFIIWDIKNINSEIPIPLRIIFRPFGENHDIGNAAISPCGKYVIVTKDDDRLGQGNEIQFWLWSFGNSVCDGNFLIKSKYGRIQQICFSLNPNEEEFFAITLTHTVAFGYWNCDRKRLEISIPEMRRFKQINSTCFIVGTGNAASVTGQGQLLLWTEILSDFCKDTNSSGRNRKDFLKGIPLRKCSINDIKMIDNFIVTVDDFGEIRFYDFDIRLVFVCSFWKFSTIRHIFGVSFPRNYKLIDAGDFDTDVTDDPRVEIIYKSTCPTDYTLEANPFIIRNFFITTENGEIIYCDIVKRTMDHVLFRCEDVIVALDNHPHKPWILSCNRLGRLVYYDYKTYVRVIDYMLKPRIVANKNNVKEIIRPFASTLQISNNAKHVAIGLKNGSLFMIDPTTLMPLQENPFRYSMCEITRIVFETNKNLCAYMDKECTIFLLNGENEWKLIGKYRYHCKPIVNVMFAQFENEQRLITIGQDRMFVEYDLDESLVKNFLVLRRDIRLEQSAIITAASLVSSTILKRDTSTHGQIIITADDHYKLKIFDAFTADNLFTYLGPIFDTPLTEIMYLTGTEACPESFLIVSSTKYIGLLVNPIDGNPFRYSGIIAHPSKIYRFVKTFDSKSIFVVGEDDTGGSLWTLKRENSIKYLKSGGEGLLPFCGCLLGGQHGWLFNEMQDLFYYIQIMTKGINNPEERVVTDYISVTEIVDFMRGLGFFPSDFEQRNMINEITRIKDLIEIVPTEISFEDVVKLFINHKPVNGYKLDDISKAIGYFASSDNNDEAGGQEMNALTIEKILDILTERGERVSRKQAIKYLSELFSNDTKRILGDDPACESKITDEALGQLPKVINVEQFCRDLLGLEVSLTNDGRLLSTFADIVNPANINSQLINRTNIKLVDESEEIVQIIDLQENQEIQ